MIRVKINRYWLIASVLFSGFTEAQTFQCKADLDSIHRSGFYTIYITPELSTKVKTDFSDLRITERGGNQVPFLVGSTITLMDSTQFKFLDIVKNTVNDSGQTVLIVANPRGENIDGFYVRM